MQYKANFDALEISNKEGLLLQALSYLIQCIDETVKLFKRFVVRCVAVTLCISPP